MRIDREAEATASRPPAALADGRDAWRAGIELAYESRGRC